MIHCGKSGLWARPAACAGQMLSLVWREKIWSTCCWFWSLKFVLIRGLKPSHKLLSAGPGLSLFWGDSDGTMCLVGLDITLFSHVTVCRFGLNCRAAKCHTLYGWPFGAHQSWGSSVPGESPGEAECFNMALLKVIQYEKHYAAFILLFLIILFFIGHSCFAILC